MPKETHTSMLYVELAELFDRAQRAIDEAHSLAADRNFISWWCGMRSQSRKPPSSMLDD
jgi:hypothetical protein